jgi:cell division protein FtsZ
MIKKDFSNSPVWIKVIGLGNCGCNAITRMARDGMDKVEIIAMDTDACSVELSEASTKLLLGKKLTNCLGAGGNPLVGRNAAEEQHDEIKDAVMNGVLVFIVAGMGGGTGTGAATVVADVARQLGALTVGVVTQPFGFESKRRMAVAENGIKSLMPLVDTLLVIQNDRLFTPDNRQLNMNSYFGLSDEVLANAVGTISGLLTYWGTIDLDFADIRPFFKDAGLAMIYTGTGTGENRALDAARSVLASPVSDGALSAARSVVFSISGNNLKPSEVEQAAETIKQHVHAEANIVFNVVTDRAEDNSVKITLIVTGFKSEVDAGISYFSAEWFRSRNHPTDITW